MTYSLAEKFLFSSLRLIGKINSFLPKKFCKPRGPIILCYHAVDDSGWRFSTPPENFSNQLIWLLKNFKVVSLKNLVSRPSRDQLAITFDDGYKSLVTEALPIMNSLNITGALFAIGDKQSVNRSELDNELSLLTNKEVSHLKKAGWELGYHTRTHSDLRTLNSAALEQEIKPRKGFRYFAYPRGIVNSKITTSVKNAGYEKSFNVAGGIVKKNVFIINRVPIEGRMNIEHLKALLSPLGLVFYQMFLLCLVIKEVIQNKIIKMLHD